MPWLVFCLHPAGPVKPLSRGSGGPQRSPQRAVPEISVVIPHLNQPRLLAACLAALGQQTLAPDRFEVLVVDNGSTPLPTHVVSGLPGVHLACEPEPGPGPARNRGVALARAEILAFLDADCIPEPGWLAAILAAFEADPACGVIGGAVRVFAETPGRPNPAEAFDLVYGFRQELTIARHDFAATANLAVRRGVFATVGGFAGLRSPRTWTGAGGRGSGAFRPASCRRRRWRIRRAARWTTCATSGTGTSATIGACSREPSAAGRPGRSGRRRWRRPRPSRDPAHPRQRPPAGPAPAPRGLEDARDHAPLPGAADARRARGTDGAPTQRRLEPLTFADDFKIMSADIRGSDYALALRPCASRSAGRPGTPLRYVPGVTATQGLARCWLELRLLEGHCAAHSRTETRTQTERQGSAQDCPQPCAFQQGGGKRRLRPAARIDLRQVRRRQRHAEKILELAAHQAHVAGHLLEDHHQNPFGAEESR